MPTTSKVASHSRRCFQHGPTPGQSRKLRRGQTAARLLRRLHRDPAEEARRVAQYHREYEQWEHDKWRHDDVMYGREVNMKADREDRRKTTRTERRNQSEAEKLAHRDREARRNTRKIDLMIAGDEDATEAYRKKQRIDRERQELRTLNTKIGRMSRINAVAFRNADVDTLQSVAECTQAMRLMSGLPPAPPPAASIQKRKRPPAYTCAAKAQRTQESSARSIHKCRMWTQSRCGRAAASARTTSLTRSTRRRRARANAQESRGCTMGGADLAAALHRSTLTISLNRSDMGARTVCDISQWQCPPMQCAAAGPRSVGTNHAA